MTPTLHSHMLPRASLRAHEPIREVWGEPPSLARLRWNV